MKTIHYITVSELCTHYKMEVSFFNGLRDYGLIDIISIEKTDCVHREYIADLEKMIRLYKDLNLNFEGIDAVFNLLKKIDYLQKELNSTKNRLQRFEDL